jgi:hypothetical protein
VRRLTGGVTAASSCPSCTHTHTNRTPAVRQALATCLPQVPSLPPQCTRVVVWQGCLQF